MLAAFGVCGLRVGGENVDNARVCGLDCDLCLWAHLCSLDLTLNLSTRFQSGFDSVLVLLLLPRNNVSCIRVVRSRQDQPSRVHRPAVFHEQKVGPRDAPELLAQHYSEQTSKCLQSQGNAS